jgi:hypothetical protein
MNKQDIRRDTIEQVRGLINSRIENIQPVMDDYDGGKLEGYRDCIKDLDVYMMILSHHHSKQSTIQQEEPGIDC